MNEFTLEDFTRYIVNTLEKLNENIVTSNPNTTETYPLGVVSNPMESIISTDENNRPIRKRFQITIEWWTNSKYTSMSKYASASNELATINVLRNGGNIERYDDITKKYIFGASYEVYYNGLTNSLEKTK